MNPTPVNDEPEQYDVYTWKSGTRVRVAPVAPGNVLDKWCFQARESGGLVLLKHIGGKKYHANHSVPDAIPLVVRDALENHGYTVESPKGAYIEVSHPHKERRHSQIPVDASGNVDWDTVNDFTEEWARPIVEA